MLGWGLFVKHLPCTFLGFATYCFISQVTWSACTFGRKLLLLKAVFQQLHYYIKDAYEPFRLHRAEMFCCLMLSIQFQFPVCQAFLPEVNVMKQLIFREKAWSLWISHF